MVAGVPGPEVAGGVGLTFLLTSCCRGGGDVVAIRDVIAEVVNAEQNDIRNGLTFHLYP